MISTIKSVLQPIWAIVAIAFWTTLFWGLVLGILTLMFTIAWAFGPAEIIAAHGRIGLYTVFSSAFALASLVSMIMVPLRLPLLTAEFNTWKEWKFDFSFVKWSDIS